MTARYPVKIIQPNTSYILTNTTSFPTQISISDDFGFFDPNIGQCMAQVEKISVDWQSTPFTYNLILPNNKASRTFVSTNAVNYVYSGNSRESYNQPVNTSDVGLLIDSAFFDAPYVFSWTLVSNELVIPPHTTINIKIGFTIVFYIYTGGT